MNLNETTQALALAQAFDNRTVGEVNVRAWHAVLGDADAADVMQAIRDHYAQTTDWLMPAHIRDRIGVMEQRRAAAVSATGWAPGQHGVPKESAVPEIGRGDAMDQLIAAMPANMRALLNKLAEERGLKPESAREALAPRRAYWEREHKAYLRSHNGEPNPLYKPSRGPHGLTQCFKPEPHPKHPWKIGEDKFTCPGILDVPYPASYYDTQATAGTQDPDPRD